MMMLLPAHAMAQTAPAAAAEKVQNVPNGAAVPSSTNPTAAGGIPAKTVPANAEDARIDALRFRAIVSSPTVSDTVFGNEGGWRSTLADYGFGLNGLFSGIFTFNTLHQPQATYGSSRYNGQKPQFDTANNYLALTYNTSHLGDPGGLFTLMACDSGSTNATYSHGVLRLCQAFMDQKLLHNHLDIQAGYIETSFQYVNSYVGGSLASGTLGPNATLPTEIGYSGSGLGTPAVNVTLSAANFYDRVGAQRGANLRGTVYDAQVANPYGIRFTEPGEGVLWINEAGYRVFPAPRRLSTWIRVDVAGNTSEFTSYKGGKAKASGVFALGDHQFTQRDRLRPRQGWYGGLTYMWAAPSVVAYDHYYEARFYDIGPFASRPNDQFALVANRTDVSPAYRRSLAKSHYRSAGSITQFTASYTYHVAHGVFFTGGLIYAVHPSAYLQDGQGNPLIFKGVFTVYL